LSERRAPRLALEVAFLIALAVALSFAHLRAYAVAGMMALGWVFVAVFEWGALRASPHYGSGLPPSWYVPPVSLPPPRPLEQVAARYAAEPGGDEPTWIASPAMLADWPVADEPVAEPLLEQATQVHDVLEVERALAVVETRAPAAGPSVRTERHRIDPLAEPPAKSRRLGRRVVDETAYAEVPSRPQGSRLLPGRSSRED